MWKAILYAIAIDFVCEIVCSELHANDCHLKSHFSVRAELCVSAVGVNGSMQGVSTCFALLFTVSIIGFNHRVVSH